MQGTNQASRSPQRARKHAAVRPATQERSWVFPTVPAVASLVILIGTLVFIYPQTASWFSQKEQSKVTELGQQALRKPPNNNATYREAQFEQARKYNDALISGAIMPANSNIPVGEGTSTDESFTYTELLRINDEGVMGRIKYDSLGIDLPIYHGTSEKTLKKGVGHLEGTSLPIGGDGTRSVLTAHRGLPEATLFNELDRAAVGDTFTVSVLGEVLTYRVIETRVIKPEDTQAVLPEEGRDLISLITCTPLGVNSHRIFVTAERITPTPVADIEAAQAAPEIPGFPWWAVMLGGAVLALTAYVWRSGYTEAKLRERRRQRAESATHGDLAT